MLLSRDSIKIKKHLDNNSLKLYILNAMRKHNLKYKQALPGDKAVSASSFLIAPGKGFCFLKGGF